MIIHILKYVVFVLLKGKLVAKLQSHAIAFSRNSRCCIIIESSCCTSMKAQDECRMCLNRTNYNSINFTTSPDAEYWYV